MMDKSDSIIELAKALNKAQSEFKPAKKSGYNPFHKSKYSDLSDIIEAIKKPLSNNGLSYSQFPIGNENMYGVETILMHVSGEWISQKLVLRTDKTGPQAAGSAISYARRYALQGILGIPCEDDDANAATATQSSHQRQSQNYNQKPSQQTQVSNINLPEIITVKWVSGCNDIPTLAAAYNKLPNKSGELCDIIKSKINDLKKGSS